MSSDAIIAGLKQGNAMEMATIEEVKAGMNSVLDGMLRECFNRSDGLSELMEKLCLEPTSATATNLTAEQNGQLTKVINKSISNCEQAMVINDRKEKRDVEIATTAFEAERKTRNVLVDHLNEQIRIREESKKMMDAIPEKLDIHDSLMKLRAKEKQHLEKLRHSYRDAVKDAAARKVSRFQEIAKTYENERSAFRKQIGDLKRIAIIAELDLKATSQDEASDHVSFQQPQAAHTSLAPSSVGRGGRGSLSSRGGVRGLSGRGMRGGRGGRGSFQSRPTDPHPSIPDSQIFTADNLRKLSRRDPSPWEYQG